jgi:16S rRNA (guanine(966)-N(2))-methyltransferase RsmD
MRIIAGTFRSRQLKMVPSNDTRETSDKVRGAVFNSIGSNIDNSIVLDLFAGSGSYGLEAISRGAQHVVFNDYKQIAINTLTDNIKSLAVESKCSIWKHDYELALKKLAILDHKFDLVFIDPPYKLDVYEDVLNQLFMHTTEDAMIVLEMDKLRILDFNKISRYVVHKEKSYGSKKIIFIMKQ